MSRLPTSCPKPKRKAKPVKKYSSLHSSGRVKPRNVKRYKKNQLRAYGPAGRRVWMKLQPCCFCEVVGFSVSAHLETGGTGRKSDSDRTAPMCDTRRYLLAGKYVVGCHQRYDAKEIVLSDTVKDSLAARTESRWQLTLRASGEVPRASTEHAS